MARIISHSSHTERPITGGGNRGPHPPEPFGGGGGGGGGRGDGDDPQRLSERLRRYRLGLYFTIASVVMLFVAFTTLFLARKGAGKFDPMSGSFKSDWISVQLPMKILLINTAILLFSSLVMERARRSAKFEAVVVPASRIPGVARIRETALIWVRLTVVTGFGFLVGQYAAWHHLNLQGAFLDSGPASTFFFLLTGAHAVHLAAGLAVLLYASFAKGPRVSLERRRIAVDVSAWYWHFMGIMWIYVLGVLKFLG